MFCTPWSPACGVARRTYGLTPPPAKGRSVVTGLVLVHDLGVHDVVVGVASAAGTAAGIAGAARSAAAAAVGLPGRQRRSPRLQPDRLTCANLSDADFIAATSEPPRAVFSR